MTKKQIKDKAKEIAMKNMAYYDEPQGNIDCSSFAECEKTALEMAEWMLSHQVKIRKCLRLNANFDNCFKPWIYDAMAREIGKKILDEEYFTINEREVDSKLVSIEMKLSIITDKQK